MSKVVELQWANSISGGVVNVSGATLYEVRAKLEGAGAIWGRRTWVDEVRVLHPSECIRFGQFNKADGHVDSPPRFVVTYRTEIGGSIQFVELLLA